MNRTFFHSLAASVVSVAVASGCVFAGAGPTIKGSGTSKTETRQVEKFERVSIRGVGDVDVTIGPEQRVTVTADDNILPVYVTRVEQGELVLETTETIRPKTKIQVQIVVPALKAASIAGSGDINVSGLSQADVEFKIAGSGDVTASGAVDKVSTSIRGSGSIRLADLAAKDASVSVAGSGETVVNASDNLAVSIAGSGDVRYVGNPKNVQKSISGVGNVKPLERS